VGRFRQHQWLREHVSPRAHLGHTYLWLSIDPATYERLIEESRHLRPSTVDARLCAGRTAGSARGRRRRLAARPGTDGRTDPLRDDAVARSTSADRGSGIGGAGPAASRCASSRSSGGASSPGIASSRHERAGRVRAGGCAGTGRCGAAGDAGPAPRPRGARPDRGGAVSPP
jgi:hypothetical protein